ncbi:hypothetical protein SCE1572_47395 [Sorangium cellulosum So0157-2]|uniref:Uncharacterized protein n=1 Tax=Sorangium cellulosum So0157-2 TaxID=1254432 RepID=S4YF01_SORCE|nr:hypothetical protein SCE1572_47395 [Sorangium cellulosum So0157-2]
MPRSALARGVDRSIDRSSDRPIGDPSATHRPTYARARACASAPAARDGVRVMRSLRARRAPGMLRANAADRTGKAPRWRFIFP